MVEDGERPAGSASHGVVETELLLRAVNALRLDGFLTEDEYRAKRRRLTARR
jgi:hypothetical protein